MDLPVILLDYMRRFIGFGSAEARIWFIGLEQGGGENLEELERRLSAWTDMGASPFADLPEYCRRIDERRWHGEAARIQPTLGKLIRILLASQGVAPTIEAIRRYQATRFAVRNQQTVIAELMPLPSRNVSEWIYAATGVPGLETRQAYMRAYRPARLALLRNAIQAAVPQTVVFLGLTEAATWSEIAQATFAEGAGGANWGSSNGTRFVIAKHPMAFGAPNEYFEALGRALAK